MHVAIIGNGITGITAARRLRELQPGWRITVISGESAYHYCRPALMYVFMGHMRYADAKPYEDRYWRQRRIELVRGWVTAVDTARKQLRLHRGDPIEYDKLLIATGSTYNKFGWPGQDLTGVQGLYGLADLKQLHDNVARAERAVIVGGGLIGVELAEMLLSRGVRVTFLVREPAYWSNVLPLEEARIIGDVVRGHGIDLRLETELTEIVDDGSGRVRAVVAGDGSRIDCQLVGLTAGVRPNIALLEGTSIETGRGVLVDDQLRSSARDVYAAGDCAEIVLPEGQRNLLQQVWYTGRAQGALAAEVIAGRDRRYEPGIWFNSAKFFDVEYQVYGRVNSGAAGEQNLYWERPEERLALRLVHTPDEGLIGVNLLGLRFRQEVCERWIRERRGIPYVLEHLSDAAFDAELSRDRTPEIVARARELS